MNRIPGDHPDLQEIMKKKTVRHIQEMKGREKIAMLTAYDAAIAGLLDGCGIDILLVGDSLGMVVLGYESTVPVTMEEMLHHAAAVRRGSPNALVIADMPFGSFQVSPEQAVENGLRFMKEGGCDGVKVEGGGEVCRTVRALVRAGVPVMGHLGVTPQTAGLLGGYGVQGRKPEAARQMIADADRLVEAGVFSLVLECIPEELAQVISDRVAVPTLGIGAGIHCDGQVLVTNDLLGLFDRFTPHFVKKYLELAPMIREAVAGFRDDVRQGRFPGPEHSFSSDTDFSDLAGS